jgi:hypothetical protein
VARGCGGLLRRQHACAVVLPANSKRVPPSRRGCAPLARAPDGHHAPARRLNPLHVARGNVGPAMGQVCGPYSACH